VWEMMESKADKARMAEAEGIKREDAKRKKEKIQKTDNKRENKDSKNDREKEGERRRLDRD